jgi:hypothetical protein
LRRRVCAPHRHPKIARRSEGRRYPHPRAVGVSSRAARRDSRWNHAAGGEISLHNLVFGGLATRTMMPSCASAAKFLGAGPFSPSAGSPPPGIAAPFERKLARRGKKKFLSGKRRGAEVSAKPSRSMFRLNPPGLTARRRSARRHPRRAPQFDQKLARQRDDHHLAHAARPVGGARLEPLGQRAFLLEHQEPPSQLDRAPPRAR